MNRHSILYGNDPARNDGGFLTRGQRVFCSDRGRRGGCGKTFSVFLADVLPRHTISAALLGKLLIELLANACVKAAAQKLRLPFPLETIYHLRQRLRRRVPDIRSRLCRWQKAPASSRSDPLGHTIEHLQSAFPQSLCLVSDFQLAFNSPSWAEGRRGTTSPRAALLVAAKLARCFSGDFFQRATTPQGHSCGRAHPPTFASVHENRRKTWRGNEKLKTKGKSFMRNPTVYLKMRVLGAIDLAPGASIQARIKAVSQMTFTDEDGHPRQFTWRTIQTWYSRFKKHGVTGMENKPRSDKGKVRKVVLEDLMEAIRKVLPNLHGQTPSRSLLYRLCIEEGVLTRSQIADTTFRRMVKQYELLKPDAECSNKIRLAFSKAHANEMWQADTLIGPYIHHEGTHVQTRLIAFLDDASRVCCHGQFFLAENVDTLIEALRAAFYKRGVPQSLYVDNGSIYSSKEIIQICARVGCLLVHAPVRDGAAKELVWYCAS